MNNLHNSVVIPTYNGAAFLAETVESVWRQTFPPGEIIVVDDCSPDGTADLAESLAGRSPVPLRVIRLPRNSGGPGRPINIGVRAARGEYVAVLDQDDLFEPHRLEEHSSALDSDPAVAFAASSSTRIGDGQRLVPEAIFDELVRDGRVVGNGVRVGGLRALHSLLVKGNFLMGYPAFTFRRSLLERRGGVDESMRIASDYDFLCWLCLQGDVAVFPQPGYHRREHHANLSHDQAFKADGYYDKFRLLTRYIPRCPALQVDGPDRVLLWSEYRCFAYWSKRAGYYKLSTLVTLLGLRVWGVSGFAVAELAKMIPHMILSRLTGRGRVLPLWNCPPAAAAATDSPEAAAVGANQNGEPAW